MTKLIDTFRGDYWFLSNFHRSPVSCFGITFPTVENAFQASKCTSHEERLRFVDVSPGEAKKLGRRVSLRKNWNTLRLTIMANLVERKFQDPKLAAKLLATGDAELVELNTWGDSFWGRVMGKGGKNHLGRILMAVRARLQEEASDDPDDNEGLVGRVPDLFPANNFPY